MSVRARLTIFFTALFGAIVIALAVSAYFFASNDAYRRLDAALQVATGAIVMSGEHELNEHQEKLRGEQDLQSVLDGSSTSILADTQILVREGKRNVAYKPATQHRFDLRALPPDALRDGATVNGFRIVSGTFRAWKFDTQYQIYTAKPIAPALLQIDHIRIGLFFVVPGALGLAGLAGYLLAKRSLRPLTELAQTVDAVTSSDLSARVKINNRGDEISILGLRFNSLLDRLEEAFNVQRQFMADASHQIRTPVTIALAAAQVTSRDPSAELRDCQDSLHIIEQQMLQLRRTVEDLLFLSHADTSSLKIELNEMYLDDAVSDAVRAVRAMSRGKQQTLKLSVLPEAGCLGDADLLKQAVLVLLDNSVKFTPPSGTIEVTLSRREKHWVCSVTDSGIGISETAQSHVFERFFREKWPGNEAAPGTGLGLAIAKSIVEKHRGTLTLVDPHPGRTTFEIAIPVLEEALRPGELQAKSFPVRM